MGLHVRRSRWGISVSIFKIVKSTKCSVFHGPLSILCLVKMALELCGVLCGVLYWYLLGTEVLILNGGSNLAGL